MSQKTSLSAVAPRRANWFGFSSCCLLVTTYSVTMDAIHVMKERFYSNVSAVLEDKRNNCIFLSRKVILRHRVRWGKLRTTQTG